MAALAVVASAVVLAACDRSRSTADATSDDRPLVVATTTMLEDLARTLAGDDLQVAGIMRPGGDPHLYQPTPSDMRMLARSVAVVTNGLQLEGWIDDLVRNAGGQREVIVASAGVDVLQAPTSPGGVDPHFWFDVSSWARSADTVARGLVEVVGDDSPAAARIEARLGSHRDELQRLDAWVREAVGSIPADGRVLVTSHDAFGYFGRSYGIDVVGVQGISTDAEPSQRDIVNVIETVRARRVRAVFIETSVNPTLVERIARETGVTVAGPLYSDSLGPVGSPAADYVGMVTENTRMIVEALGGEHRPFDRQPKAAAR